VRVIENPQYGAKNKINGYYAVGFIFANQGSHTPVFSWPGSIVTNTPILIKLLLFQAVCGRR
jgi:hypothetical protein